MNSLLSMKSKLEPLGLYAIDNKSNIFAELKAYAAGLDFLFKTLDEMTGECFIDTAKSYGITQREKLIGAERSNYSLEQRRIMLKDREQTMGLACTWNAFEKMLVSYGLFDFKITENPTEMKVTIDINDTLDSTTKKWVQKRVDEDFPTHLLITLNFN